MRQPKQIYCANDNAPLRAPRMRKSFKQVNMAGGRKAPNPIAVHKQKAAALWIIPIIAMASGAYAIWQTLPLNTLLGPSLVLGTILLLTALKSEKDSRIRNISGLLMVAAFSVSLCSWLSQNGFTLIGVELALLVSSLALLIGWMFKSGPAVLLSAFSALLYLASFYPELGLMTGISDELSQLGSGLLPFLILGQIVLAEKLRSSLVLLSAIIAAYIWLGTLTTDMPLNVLAGIGFAIAAAHYWLGKAWSETGKFGADLHRVCAWLIALCAALYVQSVWMQAEFGQAKPVWSPSVLWWGALGVAMATLFIASLMRYKTSHISLAGIIIVLSVGAAIPLGTAKPDLVYSLFDLIPGLMARPGLGLMIGAVIIATGFLWVVSGLKHGRLLDMSMGAIMIGIEAIILFQPDSFNADLGVVFIVSLICALCFGGLVAGASPNTHHPAGHYA